MHDGSSQRSGKFRVVVASLVVAAGVLFVAPSFDFDSDDDGVADAAEVYERGSDPAEPDARYNRGLATHSVKAQRR